VVCDDVLDSAERMPRSTLACLGEGEECLFAGDPLVGFVNGHSAVSGKPISGPECAGKTSGAPNPLSDALLGLLSA
jgi:hypothetical protein